jgi:hypothetical protein
MREGIREAHEWIITNAPPSVWLSCCVCHCGYGRDELEDQDEFDNVQDLEDGKCRACIHILVVR